MSRCLVQLKVNVSIGSSLILGQLFSKWRPEFHNRVQLSTDSSGYRYGALVDKVEDTFVLGDYWPQSDNRPIHKEGG